MPELTPTVLDALLSMLGGQEQQYRNASREHLAFKQSAEGRNYYARNEPQRPISAAKSPTKSRRTVLNPMPSEYLAPIQLAPVTNDPGVIAPAPVSDRVSGSLRPDSPTPTWEVSARVAPPPSSPAPTLLDILRSIFIPRQAGTSAVRQPDPEPPPIPETADPRYVRALIREVHEESAYPNLPIFKVAQHPWFQREVRRRWWRRHNNPLTQFQSP